MVRYCRRVNDKPGELTRPRTVSPPRGLLHDPEMYPDPMQFRPERYLRDGVFECTTNDPSRYAFGFGRRLVLSALCTHVASANILALSTLST